MLMKTSNVMDINDNFVPQAFGTLKVNNNILATVSNEDVIGRPDVISYGDRRYNFQKQSRQTPARSVKISQRVSVI